MNAALHVHRHGDGDELTISTCSVALSSFALWMLHPPASLHHRMPPTFFATFSCQFEPHVLEVFSCFEFVAMVCCCSL